MDTASLSRFVYYRRASTKGRGAVGCDFRPDQKSAGGEEAAGPHAGQGGEPDVGDHRGG